MKVLFREQIGLPEKASVPSLLTINIETTIDNTLKQGLHDIKFDLLLKLSLEQASLETKAQKELQPLIKQAYAFVVNHPDKMAEKA
jgi:hypothetical protein